MIRSSSILALFRALFSVAPAGQEQRGSIEGVVRDTSGGVLPGITVEARSPALVGLATAVSDNQGVYRFPSLSPGAVLQSDIIERIPKARDFATMLTAAPGVDSEFRSRGIQIDGASGADSTR